MSIIGRDPQLPADKDRQGVTVSDATSDIDHLRHQLQIEQALREAAERQLDQPRRDMFDLVQMSGSLLVLLGLGLYAAIRLGQQVFYNRLGVRPEEVGLTYAASISRAAVVIVVVLSGFALVFAFLVAGTALGNFIDSLNLRGASKFLIVVYAVVLFATGVGIMFAASFLAGFIGDSAQQLVIIALTCAGFILMLYGFIPPIVRSIRRLVNRLRHSETGASMVNRDTRTAVGGDVGRANPSNIVARILISPGGIVVAICLVSFTSLVISATAAARTADRVENGERITPSSGFGILGLRAEPVLVLGDLPDRLELSNRIVTYLGQSEGTIVLYDVGSFRTIRVPADGVALFPGSTRVTDAIIRPGQGLDLDETALVPTKDIDSSTVEFHWRRHEIIAGSLLDPRSIVRAGIVDEALVPSRDVCTNLKFPFLTLNINKHIRRGSQFCIHTTKGRWALLTVTKTSTKPREIRLEVVSWPA